MRGSARPAAGITIEIVVKSGNAVLGVFPLTGALPTGFLWKVSAITGNVETSGDVVARLHHDNPLVVDAIKSWAADMTRRGCKPRSVERMCGHATELCARHAWREVRELTLEGAVVWLGENRASRRWSGPTHDQVCSSLRCWGQFLHDHGTTVTNVFGRIEPSGEVGGEGSRAMLTSEARLIVAAARNWETHDRKVKSPLALWYTFLCLSGLRVAEARRVRWQDVDLGERPAITTDPSWSKNGRRMRVPVNAELAPLLRSHRQAGGAPGAPVFPVTPNAHSWAKVLSLSGVPYEDDRRRVVSPHSCRKWLATELDRLGAPPGVQALALRHFEGVTQRHYVDRLESEAREFFENLPNLWPTPLCEPDNSKADVETAPNRVDDQPEKVEDGTKPSGRSAQDEHPTRARQWALPSSRTVLDGVVEAHSEFLKLIATALRGSDSAGPTDKSSR